MAKARNRRGAGGKARSSSAAGKDVGVGFSLASFVAGVGVGAVAAVLALYALEGEEGDVVPAGPSPVASVTTTPLSYEFWERLPSERLGEVPPRRAESEPAADDAVTAAPVEGAAAAAPPGQGAQATAERVAEDAAVPVPAANTPAQTETPAGAIAPAPQPAAPVRTEYLLQAGAFREAGAADKRRAELILAGIEAETTSIGVEDGVLYRVIVGPFSSMRETRRVMGELQERSIAPIVLQRAARPG